MNLSDWSRDLALLHKSKAKFHFEIGDYMNSGIKAFGSEECFAALKQISRSRFTRNFYRRCAVVAAIYPPSLRFANLTFNVYEALRHFPLPFLSTFIPSVADSGRSCKQIRHLAIEQNGGDPAPKRHQKKRYTVHLSGAVYLAALEAAKKVNQQPQFFIEMILKDWLKQHPDVQVPPVPDKPTAPCDVQSAEPCPQTSEPYKELPTYNQRREKRLASGAKKISVKPVKRKSSLRVSWTECKPATFLDSENGVKAVWKSQRADCFATEAAAIAARDEHALVCGYKEQVEYCEIHNAYHVAHRYSKQVIVDGTVRHVSA